MVTTFDTDTRKEGRKKYRKKYIVIVEQSPATLEDAVGAWMAACYSPLGGVCVYVVPFPGGGQGVRFAQAMMKRQGD